MIYYCFVADCYVGVMNFRDSEIVMSWEDDSKLSDLAKMYKKITPMSNQAEINAFISERVPSRKRAGVAPFLAHNDCNLFSSDIEIFQKCHGVSNNDLFWIDTDRNSKYWEQLRTVWNI
jgi:hypothetical protein